MTAPLSCPACAAPAPAGASFCGQCGTRLTLPCPQCEARNPLAYRFCSQCGSALPAAVGRAERRLVTVLFADVEGFVAATAGLDAEVVAELMNRYFARVGAVVHQYGGTVDKYMGDAVMALFGAPTAHEDDAERAVRAALGIQQALAEFRTTELAHRRVSLLSRIGIASGEVLYGPLGAAGHAAMTAVGEPVNLAARLEAVAPAGGILVCEATYRRTATSFAFERVPDLCLHGFARPVPAYRVRAASDQPLSHRGLPGSTAGLVGRTTELATLRTAWEQAARGRTTILELRGEAGIGKSRLVRELLAEVGNQARLVSIQSSPYDQATAFGLARRLAQALAPAVAALPTSLAPHERDILTGLLSEPARPRLEAARLTEDAAAAAGQALSKLLTPAGDQPLVIVLEDLHWADRASLLALGAFVEQLTDQRLLLILVSRPESTELALWSPRAARRLIDLPPLSREHARQLLQSLVGAGVLPAPVEQLLLDRAAGNPFFLEELVRSLVESGMLSGPPEARQLVGTPTGDTVPVTLRAVIAARIDRLVEEDRLVLQQAAVLGSVFDLAVLRALTGQGAALEATLARLESAYAISADPHRPGWFTFRHPLVREVAYQTLSLAQRRALHAAAAAALQQLGPPSERLGELLYHLERGEQWEQAAATARRAAEAARRLYAQREAIALLTRALSALEAASTSPTGQPAEPLTRTAVPVGKRLAEMATLRMERAEVAAQIGEYPAAIADLNEALRLASQDRPLRAAILCRIGELRERMGDFAAALQALNAALQELNGCDDRTVRGRVYASLSLIYYQQGEVDRAAHVYARALSEVGAEGDHREISRAYLELNRPGAPPTDPVAATELHTPASGPGSGSGGWRPCRRGSSGKPPWQPFTPASATSPPVLPTSAAVPSAGNS
ncbi:MAG: hypothetical protein KatS3mg061_3491 [Dehalococcoidia bacterium]|nr:MAG: hypothetical protein KatS3mg061_3491 [Dehalococcoidia bacterium]